MSKVSIIMGVYNDAKKLIKSIDSIIQQTFTSWELIIINDASSDKTQEILDIYQKQHSRISSHRNNVNNGLAFCLNKAFKLSSGKYIARMDSDDISLPTRLEDQVRILDKNTNISVVGSGAFYFNSWGRDNKVVKMPEKHEDIIKNIFKTSPFIHPSVLMRRSYFELTNGYDEKLRRAQDYDLWLRGRKIGEYYNIPKPLIYYYDSKKKLTSGFVYTFLVRIKNSSNLFDIANSIFWSIIELIYTCLILIKKIARIKASVGKE